MVKEIDEDAGIKVTELIIKGRGKFPMKYPHVSIVKTKDPSDNKAGNEISTVSFGHETVPVEKGEIHINVDVIYTNDTFLRGAPKDYQIVIIESKMKTIIFTPTPQQNSLAEENRSKQKLANIIADSLNKIIFSKKIISKWSVDQNLTINILHNQVDIAQDGEQQEESEHITLIVPIIEDIMKQFYGVGDKK